MAETNMPLTTTTFHTKLAPSKYNNYNYNNGTNTDVPTTHASYEMGIEQIRFHLIYFARFGFVRHFDAHEVDAFPDCVNQPFWSAISHQTT